jgi:hypothetical protein
LEAKINRIDADDADEQSVKGDEKNCPGNCQGQTKPILETKLPSSSVQYGKDMLSYVPEQPSLICCDSSCPKCLGGIPPRPGSNQCMLGCPSGGCAGSCPCDQCICCYTTTNYITSETTCLDFTTIQTILEDTSTVLKLETIISEYTKPVTFTVLDEYVFTSYETFEKFATEPTFVTEMFIDASTTTATIYAEFSIVDAVKTFTKFLAPTTITTNPIGTTIVANGLITRDELVFTSTIKIFGDFSFAPSFTFATTTVMGFGTFYEYVDASGTLSLPTTTICGASFATIFNYSGVSYISTAMAKGTATVSFSTGSIYVFTRPFTTITVPLALL